MPPLFFPATPYSLHKKFGCPDPFWRSVLAYLIVSAYAWFFPYCGNLWKLAWIYSMDIIFWSLRKEVSKKSSFYLFPSGLFWEYCSSPYPWDRAEWVSIWRIHNGKICILFRAPPLTMLSKGGAYNAPRLLRCFFSQIVARSHPILSVVYPLGPSLSFHLRPSTQKYTRK